MGTVDAIGRNGPFRQGDQAMRPPDHGVCSGGSSLGGRFSRRTLLAGTAAAAAVALNAVQAVAVAAEGSAAPDHEVWDGHVHLSGVSGDVEERVDQLLETADRMGIARLVVFLATPRSHDPAPDEVRHENDQVLRAIRHAPNRVLGMVYLNPKHGKASLEELSRCVQEGPMVGVKLWVALRCSRPELDPIVRRAVELRIPVLQHAYDRTTENLPGESSCADVVALAARHPDASFICAH
ncbi:MAG: amidohydrolase family protein, partial [Patescibacteria group bacterium]|nr:amidohydrolase family protein [Patescibacteria group bacterium]